MRYISKQRGFTLLELVIVLSIVGILGYTAISRFSGPTTFIAKTASAQGLSIIRQIQLARMQSSALIGDENHILQVTENCFGSKQACESGDANLSTRINLNSQSLRYSTIGSTPNEIAFDSLGRPEGLCDTNTPCNTFYTITLQSAIDSTADISTICINEEGYAYILPVDRTVCAAL